MFRPDSKNRPAIKLTSVALSVFLYVLTLPIVSSAPRLTHSVAKPEARIQQDQTQQQPNIPIVPSGSAYLQTNLVSDSPGVGLVLDPLLVTCEYQKFLTGLPYPHRVSAVPHSRTIVRPEGAGLLLPGGAELFNFAGKNTGMSRRSQQEFSVLGWVDEINHQDV